MKRLHFVSAPGGSAFMHELLTVVAHEVSELGAESGLDEVTVSEGPLPSGGADDVYVVVPHEYFVVLPPELHPGPAQLERTIGFCVEHPGTVEFETTLRLTRSLAACVDINDDSTGALNAHGIATERFVLGYSERWDRWGGGANERPLDVVYLGSIDDRRSRLLALDFEVLDELSVLYAMPPNDSMTPPLSEPRPDFFMGEEKLDLLATCKILLNLHREHSRSLEWVRVLEAMCNGCVVVSEYSPDFAPLRPGEHLLLGRPRVLVHLARAILSDRPRLEALRIAAYDALRTELTMRPSALMLAQLAADVARGAARPRAPRWQSVPRPVVSPAQRAGQLLDEGTLSGTRTILRTTRPSWTRRPAAVRATASRRQRNTLDAAVVCSPGSLHPAVTLVALMPQLDAIDAAVHLCFDGVEPVEIPDDPRIVVHGGRTRTGSGLPLNDALDASEAERILVLDAGDQPTSHALERLASVLRNGGADAAYGMVVTPEGLFRSALPFEPSRLRWSDYIATASLWRRATLEKLGGWSEDPDIDGAETWDLWRRLAADGGSAVLVPRPLIRQAFRQDPPLSRYEFDPVGVGERLAERAPTLAAL